MAARVPEREFTLQDGTRVRVRRSTRRRRGASYQWVQGVLSVGVPARCTKAQEEELLGLVLEAVRKSKRRHHSSDTELLARAHELSAAYLDGAAQPVSVRWVGNQRRRWGSTTAADGSIRLSTQLQGMPQWVIDGVLVHELSHLLADDGHGPRFRSYNERYPRHRESKAFLDGVVWGRNQPGAAGSPSAGEDESTDDIAPEDVAAGA